MSDEKVPKGFAPIPGFPDYVADRRGRLRLLDQHGQWIDVPPMKRDDMYKSPLMRLRSEEKGLATLSPSTLVTMTFGFVDLPGEKWRVIPGWPSHEVSSCGRVRRQRKWGPRLLKTRQSKGGFRLVLNDGDRLQQKTVHLLVLEVFGHEPEPGEDGGNL